MYPEQWEYMMEGIVDTELLVTLQRLGGQGWELVYLNYIEWVHTSDGAHKQPYNRMVAVLKRGILRQQYETNN